MIAHVHKEAYDAVLFYLSLKDTDGVSIATTGLDLVKRVKKLEELFGANINNYLELDYSYEFDENNVDDYGIYELARLSTKEKAYYRFMLEEFEKMTLSELGVDLVFIDDYIAREEKIEVYMSKENLAWKLLIPKEMFDDFHDYKNQLKGLFLYNSLEDKVIKFLSGEYND